MEEVKVIARAKINLSLDVKGKREDGYHILSMVMQSVDLADKITLKLNDSGKISVNTNMYYLPTGEKNIAYKAAELFLMEINSKDGIEINIEKQIPVGAGMAGGSTDAAGVLMGLNKLYGFPLTQGKILDLGLSLGADVPFCIVGGTKLAEGIGEKLKPLNHVPLSLLIIKPRKSISTKEVFKKLDINSIQNRPDNNKLIQGIEEQNYNKIYQAMDNSLSSISMELVPEIEEIIEGLELKFNCKKAMMTGSGSTVFGIFEDEEMRNEAYLYYKGLYRDTFLAKTESESIIIEE